MKVLWIVCNESLSEDVREILDATERVDCYTVWEGLYGVNRHERKSRWGDSVWPGLNWAFWIVADEDELAVIMESLKKFKAADVAKLAGIKAWTQEIEAVL
jgi:hypothetical protein